MDVKSKIAVIFPIYNPEPGWESVIIDASTEIKKECKGKEIQFILVNDGSANALSFDKFDNSTFLIVNHLTNAGKGAAIRSGIKSTVADIYIYTDYDMPFGFQPIIEMIRRFETQSFDVILSKRDKAYFKMLPLNRRFVSKSLIYINFLLFKGKITDTQGGLKGYNKKAAQILLQGKQNGFLFETESLLRLSKANFLISSINVYPKIGLQLKNMNFKSLILNTLDFIKVILNQKT